MGVGKNICPVERPSSSYYDKSAADSQAMGGRYLNP